VKVALRSIGGKYCDRNDGIGTQASASQRPGILGGAGDKTLAVSCREISRSWMHMRLPSKILRIVTDNAPITSVCQEGKALNLSRNAG
jgi:hypothetical protein